MTEGHVVQGIGQWRQWMHGEYLQGTWCLSCRGTRDPGLPHGLPLPSTRRPWLE